MSEYYATEHVNEVMPSESNHEQALEDHRADAEESELVPLVGFEFTVADDTASDVTRIKEVIRASIGHSDRVDPREVPQVAIRVAHGEH